MPTVELGHLQVLLEAQTAKFEQQMEKANGKIGRTEAAISKMSRGFRTATAAITAIAGTAGLGLLIKNTVDAADKVGKLSTRLGISTEALSQYQHVADLSGVSFNTLTMGLQRMTRRVSEAAQGTGEARGALRELGISAQSLARLQPDKQFEILADAINKVGNSSDRVRLAMKLFDSEGVSLLQTMEGGAEGIRAWREQADQLGLTISQKTSRAAAELNDQMTAFTARLQGLIREVLPVLLPLLTEMAESLSAVARFAGEAFTNLDRALVGPRDALEDINEQIAETEKLVKDLSEEFNKPRLLRLNPFESTEDIGRRFDEARAKLEGLRRTAETLTRGGFIKQLDDFAVSFIDSVQGSNGSGGAIGAVRNLKEEIEDETDTLSRAMDLIERQFEDLEQQEAKAFAGLKEITKETKKTEAATKKLNIRVSETAQIYKDTATSIRQSFSDTFFRIFDEGLDSFSDLSSRIKDVFKRMLADLATLAIARPIIVPIMGLVGGLLGGNTGAVAGQLGGGGLPGGISPGSLGQFFGGNSFGAGIENAAFNLSPFSSITAENPGGAFGFLGNAGAVPNWAYGLGGILGGIAGQQLFGGYGGVGGGLGATSGMAIGSAFGPIGTVAGGLIGALAGGALGGQFGGSGEGRRESRGILDFSSGRFTETRGREETQNQMRQLGAQVSQIQSRFTALGGTGGPGGFQLEYDLERGFGVGGQRFGQNIDAALVAATKSIVDNFTGLDDELVDLVDKFSGTSDQLGKAIDELLLDLFKRGEAERIGQSFTFGAGAGVGNDYNALLRSFQANLPTAERVRRIRNNLSETFDELGTGLSKFDEDIRAFMSGDVVDLELATKWLKTAERIKILRAEETKVMEQQQRAEEELARSRNAASEAAAAAAIAALTGLISPVGGLASQQLSTIGGLRGAGSGLREAVSGFGVGGLSPLLPLDQIGALQSQFGTLSGAARRGDVGAAGQLPGVAQQLLTLSRDYYASSAAYNQLFETVQGTMADLAGQLELQADRQQATLERQLEILISTVEQANLEGSDNIVAELDELLGSVREGTNREQDASAEMARLLTDIKTELGRLRRQQDEMAQENRVAA